MATTPMQLFEVYATQRKEFNAQSSLGDALLAVLDYAPNKAVMAGLSAWQYRDKERDFICIADTSSRYSNEGRHFSVDEVPKGLLHASGLPEFLWWQKLDQDTKDFINKVQLDESVEDYLFVPIVPVNKVEGYLVVRSRQPFEQWPEDEAIRLFVYVQHLKEVFLSVTYRDTLKQLGDRSALSAEIERIAHIGGWEYDCGSEQLRWTDETYRIHGVALDHPITIKKAMAFYPPDSQQVIRDSFYRLQREGVEYEHELQLTDQKGKKKWIRTTGRRFSELSGDNHLYGVLEDITREKTLLNREKDNARYLNTIIDNLNDAVITVSEKGDILTANATVNGIFGYDPNELVGENVSVLMPSPYAEQHQQYIESYLKTGKAKIIGVGRELPAKRRNGESFPMELSLSEVQQDGQRIFIGIIKDISERKNAEDKIYRLAYYNPLTNLPNRRLFEETLERVAERAVMIEGKLTVCKVNVDRFSRINLSHGRHYGDYAISMIASRIELVRNKHFRLYHAGGDVFFFLIETPQKSDKVGMAEECSNMIDHVMHALFDPIVIDSHEYAMTMSVASCIMSGEQASIEHVYELLDMALAQAQGQGGNQHILVDETTNSFLERRTRIKALLPSAASNQELSMMLQPQYDSKKHYLSSEALVRWHSGELGNISPSEFIPIAEESGDIIAIGDWVLNEVCGLIAEHQPPGRVAINLSAKQMSQPDFESKLSQVLDRFHVSGQQLVLEITETALVKDLKEMELKMQRLAELGVEFSIDDFGTGYSSLSYLRSLPIHEIKIDKVFVDEITPGCGSVPIIDTIVQLAQGLGVRSLAEGFEDAYQWSYLCQHGCDCFQGYYLNKPLSVEDWVRTWS